MGKRLATANDIYDLCCDMDFADYEDSKEDGLNFIAGMMKHKGIEKTLQFLHMRKSRQCLTN